MSDRREGNESVFDVVRYLEAVMVVDIVVLGW